MDKTTENVARYIQERGMSVLWIAKKTGLSYKAIYPSLSANPNRRLRADEFMKICGFLDVPPERFWNPTQTQNES